MASTIAGNKSAIQESQTNINIDKRQNEALKDRAILKTKKPRESLLLPVFKGDIIYNALGPSTKLNNLNGNISIGKNQNEGQLYLLNTKNNNKL